MPRNISLHLTLYVVCIFFISCSSNKDLVYTLPTDDYIEELLDTLVITDKMVDVDTLPKKYQPSATMTYDILHTKLQLAFNWKKQHVLGVADITFKPYFKPIQSITLDAVGFDIHAVTLATSGKKLDYEYTGTELKVLLDKEYKIAEKLEIRIQYTAKPNENEIGGSDVITSNKGLFFIDPYETDPDLPTQIWTQGETDHNSRWFPTFDEPNERFSIEIILTVDDKYNTLSNGRKIASSKNPDGTRTDHWKQDRPHAPYLTMIAVGEFDEEVDTWQDIPLQYMVEKGFGKHAKKIFNHTPEMLSFFSTKLNYPFPWDKYSQIVVKEYVSGAMENTSAVIFGDFVQKTDRELIDNDNDYIVAHEMMHQWFGNLVTCEDWSNLTLNEGFANYAEYLWFEHKYGKERAEYHRINELNGYYSQVFSGGARPLIHYHYDSKEQMFDAHSYNKGGLVLHMLRDYVGDDAFFASLNKYLTDNACSAVEVDELRMAFEDTVGEDLHWFFDQWFIGTGHPYLDVKYTYNDEAKSLLVEVDQSNTPKGFHSVFKLPTNIALYYHDGSVEFRPVTIEGKQQKVLLENLKAKPATYVFDGKNVLIAMINENKTTEQYQAQFKFSPNYMDKLIAFTSTHDGNYGLIDIGLEQKHHSLRSMAIHAIPDSLNNQYTIKLQDLALSDPHSEVRSDALLRLMSMEEYDAAPICKILIESEKSYPVLAIALEYVGITDPTKSTAYFQRFMNEPTDQLSGSLVSIMPDESEMYTEYLEKKAKTVNLNYLFDFYERYQEYLSGKSFELLKKSSTLMKNIASTPNGNTYRKYMAMSTLIKIAEDIQMRIENDLDNPLAELYIDITNNINEIAKNETDPTLVERYSEIRE